MIVLNATDMIDLTLNSRPACGRVQRRGLGNLVASNPYVLALSRMLAAR